MSTRARRWATSPFASTILTVTTLLATGCLDRPLAPATPTVTARFREINTEHGVSKIDLLFMIDNSASMADKQGLLALVIQDLVKRFVDPICINPDGSDSTLKAGANGACPPPTEREFERINDIHVGIITSSLGGHGAPGVCDPASGNDDVHAADMAHLVARGGPPPVATFENRGFLNWNPGLAGAYSNADSLITDFGTMVTGVGQHGCGYEAQLEAVYRFLVDPAPYATITLDDKLRGSVHGVDEVVLNQRADFLRRDSLVAIIAVTDENDYSFVDGGIGWVAAAKSRSDPVFYGGASICKSNPNDRCCNNCKDDDLAGCTPHAQDPACAKPLDDAADSANTRASRSKEQYGIDFAWPIDRYVEGFTRPTLDRYGMGAKNPLFVDVACKEGATCYPERPANLVFFAGIVGVPWQDIARDPNDLGKGFLDTKELVDRGTWAAILGDPTASPPKLPTDPHMIVSVAPRPGIAGPDSAPGADPKSGHEWNVPAGGDLQYACTFPLPESRDCSKATSDCDCSQGDVTRNPLCQNAAGAYGKRQYGAKAYPAVRELELLHVLGEQGIVGSICPANTTDLSRSDFGYRPAIASIVARLRGRLRGRCLPRTLAVSDEGKVPCVILEVFDPPSGEACRCEGNGASPGRANPSPDVLAANPELRDQGTCTCEIAQLDGAARASCLKDPTPRPDIHGWCYVDPDQSQDPAQCELVKNCPATDKRIIRYVGDQPRGANVIICQEQSFASGGAGPRESVCR